MSCKVAAVFAEGKNTIEEIEEHVGSCSSEPQKEECYPENLTMNRNPIGLINKNVHYK